MNASIKTNKIQELIPVILLILGTVSYVSFIFNTNVWMDEAFTANLVRTDMAGVLSRSMQDTLPPLYNILLKLMTDIFGYTVPVMKLTSVIPMILTMILSATVVKKRFGIITSSIFTIALTVMPYMVFFGVEIRMYSLGFFFATASGIFAYEVVCESTAKNWIFFTLFSVLAGYSHHFAFVTVGFVYFFLLLYYLIFDKPHIRRWLFCLLATFVLYFPCLLVTLKQLKSVSGYFSMPEVTLSVFFKYMYYPFVTGCRPLSILLGVLIIFLFFKRLVLLIKNRSLSADKEHIYALLCFAVYYGVLVFGTAVSKIMTANIFVDRYLFFAFGLIWLFFAIEASSPPELTLGKIKVPVALSVIILEIVIGFFIFRDEYKLEYVKGADELKAFLNSEVSDGDPLIIYAETEALYHCLTFYDNRLNPLNLDEALLASDNTKTDYTLWLAVDSDSSLPEDAKRSLTDAGYVLNDMGEYPFDRYCFELYKAVPQQ